MSLRITQNQREVLAAVSTITSQPEYLNSTNGRLNVNVSITPSGTQDTNIVQVGGASVTLGQKMMAASFPITIASNQTSIPVSATIATDSVGLATSANQTNATQLSRITDGTNTASVQAYATGQNPLTIGPGYKEMTGLTAGSLNADLLSSTDVSNFQEFIIQVTGTWVGTVTVQGSNDNSTFSNATYESAGSGASTQSSTFTANGTYRILRKSRYLRLRMTAYTSGTANAVMEMYSQTTGPSSGILATQSGTWTVGSNSATGSAVPANAYYKGLLAQTANPAAATAGNLVGALSDKLGKQVVVGSIRDLKDNQITTITTSVSETTIVTQVASTFMDMYGLIITNTSATAVNVAIKDSTAGTTRLNIAVPAGETRGFMLNESAAIKQTTVNNNWTATSSGSITSLIITALTVRNT